MMTATQFKKQQGATLIVVLLLLLIIMLLALSIATSTTSRTLVVNTNVLKSQSVAAAETGADVLLKLLKEGLNPETALETCDKAYAEQYSGSSGNNSTIASVEGDNRPVTLSWYACKPVEPSGESKDMCASDSNITDCFSVVITGVACYGTSKITDADNACTVTRYLQSYGIKK